MCWSLNVFQNPCWNLITDVKVLRGEAFKKFLATIRKCWRELAKAFSALPLVYPTRTQCSCPSGGWRHKAPSQKQRAPLTRHWTTLCLDLDLPASRTRDTKFHSLFSLGFCLSSLSGLRQAGTLFSCWTPVKCSSNMSSIWDPYSCSPPLVRPCLSGVYLFKTNHEVRKEAVSQTCKRPRLPK